MRGETSLVWSGCCLCYCTMLELLKQSLEVPANIDWFRNKYSRNLINQISCFTILDWIKALFWATAKEVQTLMGLLVGSLQTHFWGICKCTWWVANMCVERVTLNSKLWFALSLYSQAHASCSACTPSECNTANIHNEQHSVSVTIKKILLHLHRGTNWYLIKFAFCLQHCSQNTQHKLVQIATRQSAAKIKCTKASRRGLL